MLKQSGSPAAEKHASNFDPSQATNMKPWTAMNWRELLSYYQLVTLEPALRPASGCWCNIPALATAVRLAPAWHQLLSFLAQNMVSDILLQIANKKTSKIPGSIHLITPTSSYKNLGNLWLAWNIWFAHHFPSRFPTSRPSACRKAASSWSAGTGAFHNEKWPAPSLKECNPFLVWKFN